MSFLRPRHLWNVIIIRMSNVLVAIIVKMVWYPADSSLMFADWQILKVSPRVKECPQRAAQGEALVDQGEAQGFAMSLWINLAWHGSMDSEFGITRKLPYHVPPYPVALLWKATQEIESQLRNPAVSVVDGWESHGMKCRCKHKSTNSKSPGSSLFRVILCIINLSY